MGRIRVEWTDAKIRGLEDDKRESKTKSANWRPFPRALRELLDSYKPPSLDAH